MRTMLNTLALYGEIKIGEWTLFAYTDGTITARKNNGIMAKTCKGNRAGLKALLESIDKDGWQP